MKPEQQVIEGFTRATTKAAAVMGLINSTNDIKKIQSLLVVLILTRQIIVIVPKAIDKKNQWVELRTQCKEILFSIDGFLKNFNLVQVQKFMRGHEKKDVRRAIQSYNQTNETRDKLILN